MPQAVFSLKTKSYNKSKIYIKGISRLASRDQSTFRYAEVRPSGLREVSTFRYAEVRISPFAKGDSRLRLENPQAFEKA